MTTYSIRAAVPSDQQALTQFNQAMALETEGKRLDENVLGNGVAGLLNQPQYGFYLVAEREGQLVGSLMVTYEWSDWRNSLFWWIQSVYVRPDCRRQGIYSALYEKVKEMATEQGNVCGFRLYVEKENLPAQATYQKLGMEECQYYMYQSKKG
ncbi:GNAT family N-acetyltransferase [Aliiglaciecola sp. CAU 1673]|uniref:GNAT family N-acetyltransferase n=1 Tax=Aliiglaciecola sp. CAU 1673 TaxID=3032595 RepID=UPI0023DCE3A4|nr:GNAT family N-acetyltransferase [Aliiglaciecola sp. CAU 1673]MDF2177162.1 GNAT family N-acetyltransferase [Aliiglaciecola sp. CAU 1673]